MKKRNYIGAAVAATIVTMFLVGGVGNVITGAVAISYARSFLRGLFHMENKGTEAEFESWAENLDNEEFKGLVSDSDYNMTSGTAEALRLDQKTLVYMLDKLIDYNAQATKEVTISVEGFHEYQVWVDTSYIDGSGNYVSDGYWDDREEYVTKQINVSNADFESGQFIDWHLFYLYCVLYRTSPTREDVSVKITEKDVDAVFDLMSMHYTYAVDLVREGKPSYSFDECESLPHTEDIYGDPNTEEGRYTWYYPRSLLSTARSGYSQINVTAEGGMVTGATELFIPAYFEKMNEKIRVGLTAEEVMANARGLIGGEEAFTLLFNNFKRSERASDVIVWKNSLSFSMGDAVQNADGSIAFNSFTYGGVFNSGYNGSFAAYSGLSYSDIGEAAVALVLSRLDWSYSQPKRGSVGYWDCSSLVCRVYAELGLAIDSGGTTDTLLKNARDYHQEITEEELRPGDIILYRRSGSDHLEGVGHVVMWVGDGTIVHAKGSAYGTVRQSWQTYGDRERLICFARPYIGFELPERFSKIEAAEDFGGTSEWISNVGVAARIWTYCKKKGFSDIAAAALIGNVEQESSMSPDCSEEEEGGAGDGMGLFQWSWDRRTAFLSWMSRNGYELSSVEAQCEYLMVENDWNKYAPISYSKKAGGRKIPHTGIASSLTEFATYNYSSLEDATRDFGYCWEQMHEDHANWPRRLGAAKDAYAMFAGKKDATSAGKKSADGSFKNGQKIYFSELTGAEFAEFSALNTGYATYYKTTGTSNGITVCLNAGHGTPGGTKHKTKAHPDGTPKYVSGTNAAGDIYSYSISTGTDTAGGVSEASINLKVAVITCAELLNRGYDVVMIRDNDNKSPVLDNIARTVIANQTSDCHLALHFDGDGLSYDKGCFYMGVPDIAAYKAMYPVSENWKEHEALGKALVNGMVKNGVKKFSDGRIANDLTQTSYSTIPSVDIEYGNQSSNFTDSYLAKIAIGLADGVDEFFGQSITHD